jgi:peptidoglycan hydrolase-like protein with peptidoglycan-binding domain
MTMTVSSFAATHATRATLALEPGSRGAAVLKLQRSLAAAGFDPHGADGTYGSQTEAAVRSFQRARGLAVDGKAGVRTLAALERPATRPVSPAPVNAPTGPASAQIETMLKWARSPAILGSPYAAVNPFRFGDVPWDGKRHTSQNGSGRVYNIARGKTVFDCSGFVVAAYRKLGVDLAKHGLTTTGAFHADTKFLKPVATANVKPGDLILYKAHKGIGHVVIYLGNGQAVEAQSKKGVSINPVNWDHVKSVRRVPLNEVG